MTTKDKILDTAERLFARHGVEGTSLRAITKEAGVNLAAVNYHFQSKEALIHAVIARRVDPINEKRNALLDTVDPTGEGPLPIEAVLHAFLGPMFEAAGAGEFAPMIGRLFTESPALSEQVFRKHLAQVAERFFRAFHRALPELPIVELMWRMHFMLGAVTHTMSGSRTLHLLSNGLCDPKDIEGTTRRLMTFLLGGFQSPAAVAEEVHLATH